ncbi:MAG TPA: prepilin-type N-terminal cleavage/methylation domain-containing protein, partial [Acidobacteria bacterium]|nr:prepilin-type N-terminal cleavage/methylation domain-containing protein [Acidobacteriota bacterium]
MTRRRREGGFTLIELLVATLIFALVFLGVLKLLDSSTRVSKVESALADTQENVRYATYHLVRVCRMAGGTNLPLGWNNSGSVAWVAAEILDNVSSFTDDAGVSHTTLAGADVLKVRGFFESTPYFVLPANVDLSSGTVKISEKTPSGKIQDFSHLPGQGKGLVLMGRNQYAVAKVSAQPTISSGTSPNRTMTITFSTGDGGIWESLNPNGTWTAPTFDVYRVGVLDSYNYFVDPDLQLQRWRASAANSGNGSVEPVALNIGGLQVAMGMDADRNGIIAPTEWYYTKDNTSGPPVAAVVGAPVPSLPMTVLRITVLGRTPFPVRGWQEPVATFNAEDMPLPSAEARRSKWRWL